MSRLSVARTPLVQAAIPLMKGIGFVNVRHFVVEEFGDEALARTMASLDESDRTELMAAVAVGWYDVALFGRFLRAVDRVCGQGDLALAYWAGADAANRDFGRVWRTLMRVVSPEQVIVAQHRMWRHFQSESYWELTREASNQIAGVLHGRPIDDALCAELTGYFDRLFAFTGVSNVRTEHATCRARGADVCRFRTRWR